MRSWIGLGTLVIAACVGSTEKTTVPVVVPTTLTTPTPTPTEPTSPTGCAIDLQSGSEECDSCIEESCCGPLEGLYLAPDDDDAIDAFSECSVASCGDSCLWGICDSGLGLPDYAVAVCMGEVCCLSVKNCLDDTACTACLLAGSAPDCAATTLDDAVSGCAQICGYTP